MAIKCKKNNAKKECKKKIMQKECKYSKIITSLTPAQQEIIIKFQHKNNLPFS